MISYIYFIQAQDDGPIKIGSTGDDPRKRMVKIQSDCPWPVRLLGAIEGSVSQEKQIHLVLARWKTQGEWFEPHQIVIAAISEALNTGRRLPMPVKLPKRRHPLCLYRHERGMTLDRLGQMVGMSKATLSRFETGRFKPNAESLKALCRVTGIPAVQLRPDWAPIFGVEARS